MKHNSDIYNDASLIRKALMEDLDDVEQKKLDHLLENKEMSDIYNEISDSTYLKNQFLEYKKYSSSKAYAEFRRRRQNIRRIGIVQKIAVIAAVIIMGVGVVLWPFFIKNDGIDSSSTMVWGEKELEDAEAKLTLADGTEVQISNMRDKILCDKGVNIEYKDGKIAYTGIGDKTVEIAYNKLEVPRGRECMVTLEDGTKVWVNAQTILKYPVSFVGERREVVLQGEAYFEVVKDTKPFIVKANGMDVEVLGTCFNVNTYKQDIVETTLQEGSVSVKVHATGEKMILVPDEMAEFQISNGVIKKKRVDAYVYTAWKDGKFVFENETIEEIMQRLGRKYDLDIYYENEDVKEQVFTGIIECYPDVMNILHIIEGTATVVFEMRGKTIIVK